MTPSVLVTGGSGFVGRWLVPLLAERGYRVTATTSSSSPGGGADDRVRWLRLTLPDLAACRRVVRESAPDAVVHLAGVTVVPEAEDDPRRALEVNVRGTDDLLRALDEAEPTGRARFVFVSTGQVFDSRRGAPLREDDPLLPANLYARTKLAAELVCEAHTRSAGRPLVVLRPFNHAGPGQGDRMVVSNFSRQVARIELGLAAPVLETGDLSCERDFSDVRDVCEAYTLAVSGAIPPGTFNVCSGRATRLASIVEILKQASRREFEVRTAPSRLRVGEIDSLRGSSAALEETCGWRPRRPLEQTVIDTLRWWRERENG